MMWFFAVLVVLVMGGVALVAAGKGEPLAPAYDDRPDPQLPADGEIGADDLRRVRFSLAFRGYRMSEVDALLDRLAAEKEAGARRAQARAEPGVELGAEPGVELGPEPGAELEAGDGPSGPGGEPFDG